jgi:hypothetical protein
MSNPFRVAVVAEGPTDKVIVEAAISSVFRGRPFILRQLQPEESLAFGPMGTGWGGVYRWCRQASARAGGPIRNDPLFLTYDLLILHLDAEVSHESYGSAGITDQANDLPCSRPCPPPEASTNALREVMLRWIGETQVPPKTVLCTPSMKTETWVLCALYPDEAASIPGNLECFPTPDLRLQAQPQPGRVVRSGRKDRHMYQKRAVEIAQAWDGVRDRCSEAQRFSSDLMASIPGA